MATRCTAIDPNGHRCVLQNGHEGVHDGGGWAAAPPALPPTSRGEFLGTLALLALGLLGVSVVFVWVTMSALG